MPRSLDEWDHRWQGVSISCTDWHFHRRLFQRYNGLVLPPGAYLKMISHIRTEHRRTYLLRRRDERYVVLAIWVKDLSAGQLIYIVYDSHAQRAVTALAHNAKLRALYQRARDLKAAPQVAAEALGERVVAAMNSFPVTSTAGTRARGTF